MTDHHSRRPARATARRYVALPMAALVALVPLACGDDDAAEPLTTETTTEPRAEASTTTHAGHDGPREYEVALSDFSFSGLPDSIAAGSTLRVVNDAPSELHELAAFRIPDDEVRTVDELVGLPPEEMMATLGAPVMVLLAAPGAEQITAVGDGTLAEPGRYALICTIPTGVDPDTYLQAAAASNGAPPQVPGGPPHLAHGMFTEVEVS